MKLLYTRTESPVGELTLVAHEKALMAVLWPDDKPGRVKLAQMNPDHEHPIFLETKKQLAEYFKGQRRIFSIPLQPEGTEFQKKVWRALQDIPYGSTLSYRQLAEIVGNPKSCRAVGSANGKNPLSIVIPCHRVIGSNGKLSGFAGGLTAKEYLIALEKNDPKTLTS